MRETLAANKHPALQNPVSKKYDAAYLERLQELLAVPKSQGYDWLACVAGELVVDVGCGVGQDAAVLARTGASVIGLDHDEAMLATARERHGQAVEFRLGLANATGLETASVDKLRFDRVLQHIEDHEPVLAEAARVLKPGGTLQITDTDNLSLSYFMDDVALERKLVDVIASRLKGSRSLRLLSERLEGYGFGRIRFAVHQLAVYGFEEANYLVGLDAILQQEASRYGITEADVESWQRWKQSPACMLAVNIFVMQATRLS